MSIMGFLRIFREEEVILYKNWMADPQILGPYLKNIDFPLGELINEYKASKGWNSSRLTRLLYFNDLYQILGFSHFWNIDPFESHVEIGLLILPEYRKKGHGFELAKATIQHIFSYTKTNRIQSITSPKNVAVTKIWARLGFKVEGTLREFMTLSEGVENCLMASLLRNEWMNYGPS